MTDIKEKPEPLVFTPFPNVEVLTLMGSFLNLARQRQAVQCLLKTKFGKHVPLSHDSSGKPSLPEGYPFISVTHCRSAVAVAFSPAPVGVDVELFSDRLLRVAPRFLTPSELKKFGNSMPALLRAWTYKEAVFKMSQEFSSPPVVMTSVPMDAPGVMSATFHLPAVALTVVSPANLSSLEEE